MARDILTLSAGSVVGLFVGSSLFDRGNKFTSLLVCNKAFTSFSKLNGQRQISCCEF